MKVWEAAVRIFHWSLVALVAVSVITGLKGGITMNWHMKAGYALLALLLFRLVWGFIGSKTARFADFLYPPGEALAYLRGKKYFGHNPLGGYMVFGLIFLLLGMSITGLFANDDILTEGPLAGLVARSTSSFLTKIHKLGLYVLLAAITAHVGAILFYLVIKKENLIIPMLTGLKEWPEKIDISPRPLWQAAVLLALTSGLVWFIISLGASSGGDY